MTQNNDQEARNWAMLCHLSSCLWLPIFLLGFLGIPIPFLNIFGPLVVWLFKKNQHPLIDAHGKESLNFQISLTIYGVIATIIFLLLLAVTCGVGFNTGSSSSSSVLQQVGLVVGIGGIVLFLGLGIAQLIVVIIAAIRAKQGEFYRYPYTIRFLR